MVNKELRERIKSFILTGLVGLSFFFSWMLWFRPSQPLPPETLHSFNEFGPSRSLAEMMAPSRVLLKNEGVQSLYLPGTNPYDHAWELAKKILTALSAGTSRLEPYSAGLWRNEGSAIELVFSPAFSFSLWAKETGGGQHLPDVRMLGITADGAAYLMAPNRSFYKITAPPAMSNLNLVLKQAVTPDNQWMELKPQILGGPVSPGSFIPVGAYKPPLLKIKFLPEDQDRMAAAFFMDLDPVRNIRERDGRLILTDGHQALRFLSDGGLEFQRPQNVVEDGKGPAVWDAVSTANQFVDSHGGWPSHITLHDHASQDGIVTVSYSLYAGGLPVVSTSPLFLLAVDSQGVWFFRSRLFAETGEMPGEGEFLPVAEAYGRVQEYMAGEGQEGAAGEVLDVTPAYYWQEENADGEQILRPGWLFQLRSEEIFVDGYSGEAISVELMPMS